jgi:hypothetical protein
VEGDARGFRVALIADELVNPAPGGIDGLAVLEAEDWGAVALPSPAYPSPVAAPLLEQVAEQADEFLRHGYAVAVVGRRQGLDEALAAFGRSGLPFVDPASANELHAFLRATSAPRPD